MTDNRVYPVSAELAASSLLNKESYQRLYQESIHSPETFWTEQANTFIDWIAPWQRLHYSDFSKAQARWFEGARLNVCVNCVDRHLPTRADKTALLWEGDDPAHSRQISYRELHEQVCLLANALRQRGVKKGDRVSIYMPMIPEAAYAMLACARIGAIHSVVFGGFSPEAIKDRILDSDCRVVITADQGLRGGKTVHLKHNVDKALEHCPDVHTVIVVRHTGTEIAWHAPRDVWWHEITAMQSKTCEPEVMDAEDPLFILYTSGSTGKPKGVLHTSAGYLLGAAMTHRYVFDYKDGDIFWCTADVGWVTGHSYIVYGPLLQGCTTLMYEGKPVGTPDAGAFWRVISQHGVKALFTAPTAFRAIKREDPEGLLVGRHDLSCFKALFLAGERCDPDTLLWAQRILKVPVVDHWWQTETGHAIAGNPIGVEVFPVKPGSATKPMPGWDVQALGADGHPVPAGQIGSICCRLPLPPGTLPTLWNAEDRFFRSYLEEFPGWYKTGDAGMVDEDGYVHIMTRVDDVINVAGHRLSTGQMEEVLANHPDVAECAVVGVGDDLKGQVPLGFLVLKAGVKSPDEKIVADVVRMVRDTIGPVAFFKQALVVKRLPKTRSGKILRGTMQKIADSEAWKLPATIDDPAILDEISDALRPLGYAKAPSMTGGG